MSDKHVVDVQVITFTGMCGLAAVSVIGAVGTLVTRKPSWAGITTFGMINTAWYHDLFNQSCTLSRMRGIPENTP